MEQGLEGARSDGHSLVEWRYGSRCGRAARGAINSPRNASPSSSFFGERVGPRTAVRCIGLGQCDEQERGSPVQGRVWEERLRSAPSACRDVKSSSSSRAIGCPTRRRSCENPRRCACASSVHGERFDLVSHRGETQLFDAKSRHCLEGSVWGGVPRPAFQVAWHQKHREVDAESVDRERVIGPLRAQARMGRSRA